METVKYFFSLDWMFAENINEFQRTKIVFRLFFIGMILAIGYLFHQTGSNRRDFNNFVDSVRIYQKINADSIKARRERYDKAQAFSDSLRKLWLKEFNKNKEK